MNSLNKMENTTVNENIISTLFYESNLNKSERNSTDNSESQDMSTSDVMSTIKIVLAVVGKFCIILITVYSIILLQIYT